MRLALFALLSLTAATSASALTYYPDVVRVRVTSATGASIQLGEVSVTDANAIDVASAANGGRAFAPNAVDAASGAANAIDGRIGGVPATGIYRSTGTAGDYLDLMLGRAIVLSSITLYGRTDAATADNLYDIMVFDGFGRSLFATTVDARSGPKTTWFDVFGTPVVPGPLIVEASSSTAGPAAGAVPEPASWTLLIAGFGLTGAALRRRRRVPTAA